MSQILKVLGTEMASNTTNANTYGNATLVRVTKIGASTGGSLLTVVYSNNSTKYTVSVVGGQSLIIQKDPTDKLSSNSTDSSVLAVPVAFSI